MSFLKKIIKLPKLIKALSDESKAIRLYSSGRPKEALRLLDKHTEIRKMDFKYHLNRGRCIFVAYHDYEKAIEAFSQGLSLVKSECKIKSNDRKYIFAWIKYMIAWCYHEIGETEISEYWRTESEKHHFDFDKVRRLIKCEFPSQQIDYRLDVSKEQASS
jgi:tetratricopeptide (TPR) repeat protein